jgi:hypothetical protein
MESKPQPQELDTLVATLAPQPLALSNPPLQPIWGAKAIGDIVGKSRAATYFLLETGKIPGRKVGRQWLAEYGELQRWMTNTV